MSNIREKLLNIQTELVCEKKRENKFGGYKYRTTSDILEALKPLLAKNKTVIHITDKIILVGNRVYVEATATLKDVESNEEITTTALARETETRAKFDEAQLTGSASTYARKYALNGLLAIDDVVDPDETNIGDDDKKNTTTPKVGAKVETPKPTVKEKIESIIKDEPKVEAKPEIKTTEVATTKDTISTVQEMFPGAKQIYNNAKEIEAMMLATTTKAEMDEIFGKMAIDVSEDERTHLRDVYRSHLKEIKSKE